MQNRCLRKTRRAAALTAVLFLLGGCSQQAPTPVSDSGSYWNLTADNEIISYAPVQAGKTIITIGKYQAFDETPLENAIEAEFPDLDIIFVESLGGSDPIAYMALQSQADALPDLMLSTRSAPDNEFLYDLSAESFVSRYNLSSLNAMDIGGKLFQIPAANTVIGIAYNKTLFEQNGWTAPESLEEFYSLCDTIAANGIRPFVPCLKYYTTLESIGLGLSYDSVFSDLEKQTHYNAFIRQEASCEGLMEPMFETLRTLYEKGIITEADFSSSATEVRHSLYAGEYAMMATNLDIVALYQSEQPDCEIDFIGFPTNTPGERWMQMVSGTKLSASKKSMEDTGKQQILLDILDYFSTDQGQSALFQSFSGVSSLTSYQQKAVFAYEDIQTCIQSGRIFFADYFGSNDDIPVFRDWTMGKMAMAEMIKAVDDFKPIDELKLLEEDPIGTAKEAFTRLETSIYMADVMQQLTGAEIALMPNNYYYRSNFAEIFQGPIVYPERFILKGTGAKDYLATYQITGAALRELLEHPVINGTQVNVLYAPAGLKLEYAPWADMDENVRSITLADGTALDNDRLYTVAARAGCIDEQYITGLVKEYPEAGSNQEMMTAAIRAAGTISPARDGRVSLIWE